jgi:myo-inositol-1(or 4)-monophosphatase
MVDTNKEINFAVSLAKQAGVLMKKNFSLGMKRELKSDLTPVTATDLAINSLVLDAVVKTYPAHSFIGEEGSREIESEYAWVCDPIDGTMPFTLGYPTFVFSLALTKNGESILGVIYDPMCDRLVTAEKGKGAFLNGSKISVSNEKEITRKSFIETGGYSKLPDLQRVLSDKTHGRILTILSGVYAGMLVATGEIAGQIYKYDKPWDAAAVKIIVEEAGGKVTDLDGNEQRYDRDIHGFVSSNGFVHQQLLDVIALVK